MPTARDTAIERPVFLIGAERSGTTLLRLMLDHHPAIALHYEFEYAVRMLGDDGARPPLDAYLPWLKSQRIYRDADFRIDEALGYDGLLRSFLRQKRERDGKSLVGATVHHHFDRLPHLWPGARYIHLIRDGRDVARSNVAMGWAGNVWAGADRWLDAAAWWDTLRGRIAEENWTEVRYEELIADPRQTLSGLCQFLDLPFDEAMFDYAKTSTYSEPDPSRVGRWRHKLSEREIRLLESRIGPLLEKRGYALSGLPPLLPDAGEIQRLHREDRWRQRRFRIDRYGAGLWLLENLARRLPGLASLHRRLLARMERIDRRYIK